MRWRKPGWSIPPSSTESSRGRETRSWGTSLSEAWRDPLNLRRTRISQCSSLQMDEKKQPGIRIGHVFLMKAVFEHRGDFLSLPANHPVEVPITIHTAHGISEDGKSGFIGLGVQTDNEAKPIYRFQVEMGALIEVDPDAPNMPLEQYMNRQGIAMAFPFLREAVANITGRGRFGPVWLHPINLNAPDL